MIVGRADDDLGAERTPLLRIGNQKPRLTPNIRMNSTRCKAKPGRYEFAFDSVFRLHLSEPC